MEIHQVLVRALPANAVTKDALALRPLLRRFGPSEVFSFHRPDPGVPDVAPLGAYERRPAPPSGETVLVLHSWFDHAGVVRFLEGRPERVLLRYHGGAQPEQFERFDPRFARTLRAAREEIRGLRHRVDGVLTASRHNADELRGLGFERVAVVPPVEDMTALTAEPPGDGSALPATDGPVVTFVGRLAPNKAHELLIQAFHVLKTYLCPTAHLVLAGERRFHAVYRLALERYVAELALPDVHFTGGLTNAALADLYRRSDVFLCMSRYEGFCVPLVEAMAFGVPVVAWGVTAVGETVGDAGVVLDEPRPALAAEAVARVLADAALRARLRARADARLREFDAAAVGRRMVASIEAVLR